jgi:uncharacterized membrane protein required for colicin V production
MSVLDVTLLIIGVFFIVRGIFRGLSGEVISLLGTVGGFICSVKFYRPLENIMMEKLGASVLVATIASMLTIFLAIFFGCSLLETAVKKIISKTSLTSTDKFLGACIGVLKFYIVTLLVLVGGTILAPLTGGAWDNVLAESRVMSAAIFTWPIVSPPLEDAGVLPDVDAIQDRARDYLTQQAAQTVTNGISEDISGIWPDDAPPASDDLGAADMNIEP